MPINCKIATITGRWIENSWDLVLWATCQPRGGILKASSFLSTPAVKCRQSLILVVTFDTKESYLHKTPSLSSHIVTESVRSAFSGRTRFCSFTGRTHPVPSVTLEEGSPSLKS